MKIEEARKLKKGQTVYLPATVQGIENNGNEISISICYAYNGRVTADISAYYEQLVLPEPEHRKEQSNG